jgi:hypothetical protein
MPGTWVKALESYRYPVCLPEFFKVRNYPQWFKFPIGEGDRDSTKKFEDHFRHHARNHLEPWFEVVYWKMYSQKGRRDERVKKFIQNIQFQKISPVMLWDVCNAYVENPSRWSFNQFLKLLGYKKSGAIAIAATFPAFMKPDCFPMVDTRIAKWVIHSWRLYKWPQLVLPRYPNNRATVLKMADFDFMESWTCWCSHAANKLTRKSSFQWRARDVEMAVFQAWGACNQHPAIVLNALE